VIVLLSLLLGICKFFSFFFALHRDDRRLLFFPIRVVVIEVFMNLDVLFLSPARPVGEKGVSHSFFFSPPFFPLFLRPWLRSKRDRRGHSFSPSYLSMSSLLIGSQIWNGMLLLFSGNEHLRTPPLFFPPHGWSKNSFFFWVFLGRVSWVFFLLEFPPFFLYLRVDRSRVFFFRTRDHLLFLLDKSCGWSIFLPFLGKDSMHEIDAFFSRSCPPFPSLRLDGKPFMAAHFEDGPFLFRQYENVPFLFFPRHLGPVFSRSPLRT